MKPYNFLLIFIAFLFLSQDCYSQNIRSHIDSLDAIIIHYEEINNNDPTILNHHLVITDEHIFVLEEREKNSGSHIQKRCYDYNYDHHIMQFSTNSNPFPLQNEVLFPITNLQNEHKLILGLPCTLARYNGDLKAYYTQHFGVKFSTTVNHPGIALYYEKPMAGGISKYQADWVKQQKLPLSLLNQLIFGTNELIDNTIIFNQSEKRNMESKIKAPLKTSSIYESPFTYKLNYTNQHNEYFNAYTLNNHVLVSVFANTLEEGTQLLDSIAKESNRLFSGEAIKYILFVKEKIKLNIDHMDCDVIKRGYKFKRLLQLEETDNVVIFDRATNVYNTFSIEQLSNFNQVMKSIGQCLYNQFYHGYLNPANPKSTLTN